MKKKSVTMSDIAKAMDISTVTVSKALGDKDGVSDELREKIKQKARISAVARAAARRNRWVCFMPFPPSWFFDSLF